MLNEQELKYFTSWHLKERSLMKIVLATVISILNSQFGVLLFILDWSFHETKSDKHSKSIVWFVLNLCYLKLKYLGNCFFLNFIFSQIPLELRSSDWI